MLLTQSEWIEPEIRLHVCTDTSDNRFLEWAVAGGADYLVTKDIRHFPSKVYAGVKMVRIREFLRVLEQITKTQIPITCRRFAHFPPNFLKSLDRGFVKIALETIAVH